MTQRKATKQRITQRSIRAERALVSIPHPGLVFSQKHHVFIAKAKRGELWALNHLSIEARAAITPLFEMWPPPTSRSTSGRKKTKSLHDHATSVLQMIRDEWGKLPFFLDTRYIPAGGMPSPSDAKTIFDVARTLQLNLVPTTSIKYSQNYQTQIRDIIAADGRGVLLRLFINDFINPTLLGDYLDALTRVLGVALSETDVVIDLEYRPEHIEVRQLGSAAISVLPHIDKWRTVTLAAGCFPQSISKLTHNVWSEIRRSDWLGWQDIVALQAKNSGRLPSYGDYAIRCGGPPAEIPKRPDPNLRYTAVDKILVCKEAKTDGKMKAICSALIAKPEFSGPTFSQGDVQIAAKAAMPGSPNNGQAEQWIEWCTNHHLELTASQIRSLP